MVVGGDPGGMGAISAARAGRPDLEVVAFEQGSWTSYSACGIPYLVGGEVARVDDLVTRSPETHREAGIDVRLHHRVTALDLDRGEVEVHDLESRRTRRRGSGPRGRARVRSPAGRA